MKTSMQEMTDWLKRQEAICLAANKQHEADFLNGHILVAISLLEKEKQQIIGSFNAGRNTYPEPNLDGLKFYNIQYDGLKNEFKKYLKNE